VARAASDVPAPGRAVDAYGGVGLFAATVLERAGRVTVLESSRRACADARHNLRGRPVRVVRTDVGGWRAERGEEVGLVIADPARPGLGRPGTEALASTAPAPLVLVSCDPVSLARDAALLREHGYRPESVEVVDVFPQTPHVEAVTRFTWDPA
jgi:23S rRNA (uracil1939-C5)-methyltransferase